MGFKQLLKHYQNLVILTLILLVGLFFRLTEFNQSVFFYDELSAIFRARFFSFSDLIEFGVKVDGHPAGLQFLIWTAARNFGENPFIFKGFIILIGLINIVLIYLISKKYIQGIYAFIPSIFQALIYNNIYWDRQVRPYTLGVFMVLLFFYSISKLDETNARKFRWILISVLAAAGSYYVHYIAALNVVVIALIYYFKFEDKGRKFDIFRILLFSGLAFIPHLSVFIFQLKVGGVGGWLAKPDTFFLTKYIGELFSYNIIAKVLFYVLIFIGISQRILKKEKIDFLFILLFIIPFLFTFIWSLVYNPVLQSNILQFSLPFLWIFFAICLSYISNKKSIAISLLFIVLATTVYSNIATRNVLHLNSTEGYSAAVRNPEKYKGNAYFYGAQDVWDYHIEKACLSNALPLMLSDTTPLKDMVKYCSNLDTSSILLNISSGSPAFILPMLIAEKGLFYSKNNSYNFPFVRSLNLKNKIDTKELASDFLFCDYKFEFGKQTITNWGNKEASPLLFFTLKLDSFKDTSVSMVAVGFNKKNEQIFWVDSKIDEYRKAGSKHAYLILQLWDFENLDELSTIQIKLEKKSELYPSSLSFRQYILPSNPYVYGY